MNKRERREITIQMLKTGKNDDDIVEKLRRTPDFNEEKVRRNILFIRVFDMLDR